MADPNRRVFLGGLAVAAGGLVATPSRAAANDGHAAGYDVAPASDYVPLIPRRAGDGVTFTASLDKSPIKATSGGWARDITTKSLPVATDIAAGRNRFIAPFRRQGRCVSADTENEWRNKAIAPYVYLFLHIASGVAGLA
jgi:oxalate decarboxylase